MIKLSLAGFVNRQKLIFILQFSVKLELFKKIFEILPTFKIYQKKELQNLNSKIMFTWYFEKLDFRGKWVNYMLRPKNGDRLNYKFDFRCLIFFFF